MQITKAQIPWADGESFSVEQLATWCCSALQERTRGSFHDEGDGVQTPKVSSVPYQLVQNGIQKDATVHRVVLPLKDDWRTSGKHWLSAEEVTTDALPAGYDSN